MINSLLNAPHLLIAGATGSGKSTFEQLLLYTLTTAGSEAELILIDPKRVELRQWAAAGTCRAYADSPTAIYSVLLDLAAEMDQRYAEMQKKNIRMYDGSAIYVFIDEYADIVYGGMRREIEPILCRLLPLSRAAKIHIILCTQRPTSDILSGMIKTNIVDRVALHTATAQDSRNIIGVKGAELLPRFGEALIQTADGGLLQVEVEPVPEEELNKRINALGTKPKMTYFQKLKYLLH